MNSGIIIRMVEIYSSAILRFAKEKQPSAGMAFVCLEDQTIFLTKRGKQMSSAGSWDIQGGRYDEEDIDSKSTATREAKEEITNLPKNKKLLGKHVLNTPDKNQYVIYIYSISKEEKEQWTPMVELDHESETAKWFPIDNLPKKMHLDLLPIIEFLNQQ